MGILENLWIFEFQGGVYHYTPLYCFIYIFMFIQPPVSEFLDVPL